MGALIHLIICLLFGCPNNDNPPSQCFLDPEPGPIRCLAYIPRYFYNAQTERCERFIYGGCGGTANNFETKEECSRVCARQCFKAPDSGPCEAAMTRYFYNSTSDTCEEFTYGGCQGNDNNFENLNDCLDQCGDICEASPDPGPCRGSFPRFFYNSSSGLCETFIYGGCGGNQNNFENEGRCNETCASPLFP